MFRSLVRQEREQTLRGEWQAIADQANDRANFLRLAETLTAFLARLRSAADTLDVSERQRIVRLVIKEILVGDHTIVIRHCIPVASGPRPNDASPPTPGRTESAPRDQSYLLCKGSALAAFVESDAGCLGQGTQETRPLLRTLRR
jgi:site-specific DNA recombinase